MLAKSQALLDKLKTVYYKYATNKDSILTAVELC